eukprot:UN20659
MSFMTLKNVCAKALAKNFQGFSMFFKFKGSYFVRFFSVFFVFLLFFYSFVCAIIT